MVTVRSIEGRFITTESYTELIKAVKDELDDLKGFQPQAEFLTHTSAIIYFGEIKEEPKEEWSDRYCCECAAYDWGRGCPFREGHVTVMMPACSKFTLDYDGGEE